MYSRIISPIIGSQWYKWVYTDLYSGLKLCRTSPVQSCVGVAVGILQWLVHVHCGLGLPCLHDSLENCLQQPFVQKFTSLWSPFLETPLAGSLMEWFTVASSTPRRWSFSWSSAFRDSFPPQGQQNAANLHQFISPPRRPLELDGEGQPTTVGVQSICGSSLLLIKIIKS